MSSVLAVTFPFFALVLCGSLAARRNILAPAAIPGLNGFVLYFALPAMLFRFGAQTPLARLLDARIACVYLACALVLVAVVIGATRSRMGWNDAAFGALVTAFPNTGFMGVPLLSALLGAAAAGPVIQTIAVDLLVTTSLCIALSRLDGADRHGAAVAVRKALRGMASNPMPWSILLGVLASATGTALPRPLDDTVALLAEAASPVALFTIGAVLARSQMGADTPVRWQDYVPLALAKLFLHPLLVLAALRVAALLGFALEPKVATALILVAALPSASNVALLTERFGAHNGRIARVILVSTVLAFMTFSGTVALLR